MQCNNSALEKNPTAESEIVNPTQMHTNLLNMVKLFKPIKIKIIKFQ